MRSVNSILVLVNPTAANNSGHQLWAQLIPRFEALFSSYSRTVVETRSAEHNVELGATANADLIISVGGDGTIHDIVQGIMRRPRDERPLLTMLPIGSGNDFARTLGMPSNSRRALETIAEGRRATIDIGRCNKTFFLETLSFGVDAAIALKTVKMRKTTKSRGTLLYVRAAVSAIINDLKPHRFSITTDEGTIDEGLLICAIQNGPTYGGGFRITPSARADDGILDICMASSVNRLYALYAMTLIARGRHERLPVIRTLTTRRMTVRLDQEIPTQCDGEPLYGTDFGIELLPGALDVILSRDLLL
jgi:YegS/Rv2252/BmrU family lipid kinase